MMSWQMRQRSRNLSHLCLIWHSSSASDLCEAQMYHTSLTSCSMLDLSSKHVEWGRLWSVRLIITWLSLHCPLSLVPFWQLLPPLLPYACFLSTTKNMHVRCRVGIEIIPSEKYLLLYLSVYDRTLRKKANPKVHSSFLLVGNDTFTDVFRVVGWLKERRVLNCNWKHSLKF